jgi:hypothetical protein
MFVVKVKYWGIKGFTVKFSNTNEHYQVKYIRHTKTMHHTGITSMQSPNTMEIIEFMIHNWKKQHDN